MILVNLGAISHWEREASGAAAKAWTRPTKQGMDAAAEPDGGQFVDRS